MKRPRLAVAFLAVWAATGTGGALDLGEDVVVAMRFEEGNGDVANDLSLSEHHGTVMGATWVEGRFDGGVHFDGAAPQWIDLGNQPGLILTETDFSIVVWAKMESTGLQHGFVAHDEGPGLVNKFIFRYRGDQGLINFVICNSETGIVSQVNSDAWQPDEDRWHQVAIVRRGDDYTFWVDGEPHGAQWDDGVLPAAVDAPFTIGWAEGPIAMNGVLDDVLVAKRAFDQAEITKHLKGGVKVVLAVDPRELVSTTWASMKSSRDSRQ